MHTVHEAAAPARQAPSHVSQGIELGLSGRYHGAVDQLSKAVEENPQHVFAQTSLGVAFHKLGEDERALSCYEAALRIDPIHAEAHYFRANILYAHGNFRDAIAGYRMALGLKPELLDAHQHPVPQDRLTDYRSFAAEMSWIARPARRILDLNQALVTHPGQADLFKARAAEYHRLQNYVQAVADYSSSLVIQPEDAAALHLRGVAYEQLGQFDRARADYQRAINVDPQLADVYINRGITFGQAGNFRQSIASLTDGIRLAPQNPNGYFNRGITYFQQGDLARAIEDLSMVIQLIPNDEAAYYWRGISHEEARQQEEAIADYRQFLALSQDPDAIQEIEERMSRLNTGEREHEARGKPVPTDRGQMDQVPSAEAVQQIDLYDLIVALGERALEFALVGP